MLLIALLTTPSAIEPGEARGLMELLALLLGQTKYVAAAVALGAGAIAWGQHSATSEEQPASFWASFLIAAGAVGWFVAGLVMD